MAGELAAIERMQQGEVSEHLIYSSLAAVASGNNRKILLKIASDELRHYGMLKRITGKVFKPQMMRVRWYSFLARTLGLSFSLKFMESGEKGAQKAYSALAHSYPEVRKIIEDEESHESNLIGMISEERLEYASSIVLGLNDALVELTGALAGLTLAFQNGKFIAISGLVIGIAAALSMAASSYLSAAEEREKGKNPGKSALYTGITYMLTVMLLISPYFIFDSVYPALAAMISIALVVIATYTFYISTAKSQRFLPRFAEMAAISLGVTAISYCVGYAARILFGIQS